ncbi:MAG TPA: phosphate regulon sensor protein PhoR, partial [Nevskiaceae bacterium]|nr:phosphate regulon sensor protein PhoR [Nevskiaceae bacterium]
MLLLPALRDEFPRIAAYALGGALAGWPLDSAALGACAGLALVLLSYLRNLAALRAWAFAPKHHELPERGGIWGEVFYRLSDWQRRNKRKKKKLSNMLDEFRASTAALPDGAVVLGESGEIMWYNRAAQTLLGLRPEDVGLRIANLVRHPAFSEYFGDGDFAAREADERELEVPSPVAATRTLWLRIIPYGTNQRLLIVRDVSDIKRLEAARRDFVSNAS